MSITWKWRWMSCSVFDALKRAKDGFSHSKFIRICEWFSVKVFFSPPFHCVFHRWALVTFPRTIWFDYPFVYYFSESSNRFTSCIIHEFLSSCRKSCDYISINTSIDWTCIIGCENGLSAVADKIDRFSTKLKLQKATTIHNIENTLLRIVCANNFFVECYQTILKHYITW